MTWLRSLRRVVFPHAYRIAWPAIGNDVVLLLKASAPASVVTVFDLLGETRAIYQKTFDFSVHLWTALIYLALTAVFVWTWRRFEIRLSPQLHGKRASLVGALLGRKAPA
jgi:polar amino acid transport system permease protein